MSAADPAYLARLRRYRAHLERQQRLGYEVRNKLKMLAVTERKALNGEVVEKPRPLAVAVEITEADLRRAALQLHDGYRRRYARDGACKRKYQFT